MPSLLWVAVGGAFGAIARVLATHAVNQRWPVAWPMGTVLVNISGCLVLGVLMAVTAARPGPVSDAWRTFGAVGVLGAFTTFSTFGMETLVLLQRGSVGLALLNVGGSVGIGLLAVWLGYLCGRLV